MKSNDEQEQYLGLTNRSKHTQQEQQHREMRNSRFSAGNIQIKLNFNVRRKKKEKNKKKKGRGENWEYLKRGRVKGTGKI